MSKHDFPAEEFAERLSRTRKAIGDAPLDWLIVIHPMSIHWLIGAEAKSYQAFQCLTISANPVRSSCSPASPSGASSRPHPRRRGRRLGRQRARGPVEAFATGRPARPPPRARRPRNPAYYLHPHHYVRLKDMLGDALVAEPTNLINTLREVKSPREIALVRKSARSRTWHGRLRRDLPRGPHRTRDRGRRLSDLDGDRQRAAGEHDQSRHRRSPESSATARRRCASCNAATPATSSSVLPTSATPKPSAAS